jgi:hypothetical protein
MGGATALQLQLLQLQQLLLLQLQYRKITTRL